MSAALLKPEEMAARYGVNKTTFLAWYHAGKISAEVAVGKVFRFDPEKVAAELREASKKKPEAKPGKRPIFI